ncbi:unnamed protein product [Trichobilharzia regenti]|nr:unnamed protein product [Trichobilharzia regenti]
MMCIDRILSFLVLFLTNADLILCEFNSLGSNLLSHNYSDTKQELQHKLQQNDALIRQKKNFFKVNVLADNSASFGTFNKHYKFSYLNDMQPENIDNTKHPLLSDPLFDPTILTDSAARVIQSNRCTTEERQKRIQCFDVLPAEQYAIPLGHTVNMQCVVLNQHGKVQWRAKKILLGKCFLH